MRNVRKNVFAKKSLGQNFLTDQKYIEQIISALNPKPQETIVEIGPGRGALTKHLVASQANIIAIELDKDLIPVLKKEFGDCKNFRIIEEDALAVDFYSLLANEQTGAPVKLVANLPYYISTAILQHLFEQKRIFSELILMLQREVVERITAQVGNSERGYLTVLVEANCTAEKLFDVPPNAFRPAPKVWSSVVRLTINESESDNNPEKLRQLLSLGFRQKRKTILNNLKAEFADAAMILERSNIDPSRRAESITLPEWLKLLKNIAAAK